MALRNKARAADIASAFRPTTASLVKSEICSLRPDLRRLAISGKLLISDCHAFGCWRRFNDKEKHLYHEPFENDRSSVRAARIPNVHPSTAFRTSHARIAGLGAKPRPFRQRRYAPGFRSAFAIVTLPTERPS